MKIKFSRAVTLMELMIAVVLIILIVIGISSIELFSRSELLSSERRATLQNEVSLVLAHMGKELSRAIGHFGDHAIMVYDEPPTGFSIGIREDTNRNGQIDPYPTDSWVGYRFTGFEIRFYPDAGSSNQRPTGSFQVLANHVVPRDNSQPPDSWGLVIGSNPNINPTIDPNSNFVEVRIRCRWNPAQPVSGNNPQVEMHNRIKMPSVSTLPP